MTSRLLARGLVSLSLTFGNVPGADAEQGVTAQKVVLGMSAPLSGPLGPHGAQLAQGLRLGFAEVNAAGGVAGREIELIVRDDGGQPERSIANTRVMLEERVFALTGYSGTASVEAVLPLVEAAGVPMIGVASSAEVLRDPVKPTVFNLRAGVREEAAAVVVQLDAVGASDIAAISQDDAMGRAGREGIQIELARLAQRPVVQAQIPSNADEPTLLRAVETVCKASPQVLVLALNAHNTIGVVRQARRLGCTKHFYVMSEAGAQLAADPVMARELSGVIVTQVVPNPGVMSIPIVAEYGRQAERAGQKTSYAGLEGFLYARLIVEALQRCGRELGRHCLMAALESKPLDVGGYRIQFSPTDHRGSHFVEMTILSADGRFRR